VAHDPVVSPVAMDRRVSPSNNFGLETNNPSCVGRGTAENFNSMNNSRDRRFQRPQAHIEKDGIPSEQHGDGPASEYRPTL